MNTNSSSSKSSSSLRYACWVPASWLSGQAVLKQLCVVSTNREVPLPSPLPSASSACDRDGANSSVSASDYHSLPAPLAVQAHLKRKATAEPARHEVSLEDEPVMPTDKTLDHHDHHRLCQQPLHRTVHRRDEDKSQSNRYKGQR